MNDVVTQYTGKGRNLTIEDVPSLTDLLTDAFFNFGIDRWSCLPKFLPWFLLYQVSWLPPSALNGANLPVCEWACQCLWTGAQSSSSWYFIWKWRIITNGNSLLENYDDSQKKLNWASFFGGPRHLPGTSHADELFLQVLDLSVLHRHWLPSQTKEKARMLTPSHPHQCQNYHDDHIVMIFKSPTLSRTICNMYG